MHETFAHLSLPEIEKREMYEETDDPDLGDRIPDAIKDALPHLFEAELLDAVLELAAEYVFRFNGSPESVLSVVKSATEGAVAGYGEAIEHERRPPEEG
jgi:hypothetical protein